MTPNALVIDIQGPVDRAYSLAIVNRGLGLALGRHHGVRVVETALDPQRPSLGVASLPARAAEATHVIRNTYPPLVDDLDPRRRNYVYFAWEDSRIPSDWAQAFNRSLDGVLVPSVHVRRVLAESGVAIPVGVVPYGVELRHPVHDADQGRDDMASLTGKRFRFLHVSTGFARKGCDVLLSAFTREFSSRDDVCLIIKTLPQYDHDVRRLVRRHRWRPRCPEIVEIDRELDPAAMSRLYRLSSCLVHPARAEGFGLPVAEAMLAGRPVIATAYSGQADFCTDETALLVSHRLVPSRSPFTVKGAMWGEPSEPDLRRAMRSIVDQPEAPAVRQRTSRASVHISTHFTWANAADRALAFMRAVDAPRRPVRVGMVTTWNEPCGIAEYSRALMSSVPPGVIEWHVLAAHHEAPVEADGPNVVRCWRNGWPADLGGVVREAARLDLDLVHFQTHLSLWGVGEAEVLGRMAREGRRVFMSLHSVRGARPPDGVIAALRAIDRVLVFTDEDRERLLRMGLTANASVLPLGFPSAPAQDVAATARLREGGRAPLIGTFGFLRPHKQVLELIQAVALMRSRYADIGLLALTARHPSPESADYERECRATIDRLGLADRCRLMTGFLPPDECVAALSTCDVVALPYQATNDSSSAAVRLALAAHRPVLTTQVPVFDDVANEVAQITRSTPRAIASGLTRLLDNPAEVARLVGRARARVARDGFSMVSRTYAKFVAAAVADLSAFERSYPLDPEAAS